MFIVDKQRFYTLAEVQSAIDNERVLFDIAQILNEPDIHKVFLEDCPVSNILGYVEFVSKSDATFDELLHRYIERRKEGHRAIVVGNYSRY